MRSAKLFIVNSHRTAADIGRLYGVAAESTRVVYLSCDDSFVPPSSDAHAASRTKFGLADSSPVVAFVGALGIDNRKGFDTLFDAWRALCASSAWRGVLIAAGAGRGVRAWRARVDSAGLRDRIKILGAVENVAELLAACDLLVSPARYEAYGLNVHEAICAGVPAMVSSRAGIAERYPRVLDSMLIDDPEDARDLAERIRACTSDIGQWREAFAPLGAEFRRRRWSDVARDFVAAVEERFVPSSSTDAGTR